MKNKQLEELKEYIEWITDEIYSLKSWTDDHSFNWINKLEKLERLQKLSEIFNKIKD